MALRLIVFFTFRAAAGEIETDNPETVFKPGQQTGPGSLVAAESVPEHHGGFALAGTAGNAPMQTVKLLSHPAISFARLNYAQGGDLESIAFKRLFGIILILLNRLT